MKAASAGFAPAAYNIGKMYRDGIGTNINLPLAAKWLRTASDKGHARAQRALGVRYALGQGVVQSDIQALKWVTLAARQGLDDAAQIVNSLRRRMNISDIEQAEVLVHDWQANKQKP